MALNDGYRKRALDYVLQVFVSSCCIVVCDRPCGVGAKYGYEKDLLLAIPAGLHLFSQMSH